jgi:hypothetical protein
MDSVTSGNQRPAAALKLMPPPLTNAKKRWLMNETGVFLLYVVPCASKLD